MARIEGVHDDGQPRHSSALFCGQVNGCRRVGLLGDVPVPNECDRLAQRERCAVCGEKQVVSRHAGSTSEAFGGVPTSQRVPGVHAQPEGATVDLRNPNLLDHLTAQRQQDAAGAALLRFTRSSCRHAHCHSDCGRVGITVRPLGVIVIVVVLWLFVRRGAHSRGRVWPHPSQE